MKRIITGIGDIGDELFTMNERGWPLKSQELKPTLFVKQGAELPFSTSVLSELLRSVLDKGVGFRFRAKGFSMSPFIKDGDVITVSALSGASPRLGDVVAFIHPEAGRLVIHRVVGKWGDSYSIKGDGIRKTDGLVPKAKILGSVTKVERNGKEVFLGLGPESFLVSLLTYRAYITSLLRPVWRLIRLVMRRWLG